jgi:hypothetical protein
LYQLERQHKNNKGRDFLCDLWDVEKDDIKAGIKEMNWVGYKETFGSRWVPGVTYCERVTVLAKLRK